MPILRRPVYDLKTWQLYYKDFKLQLLLNSSANVVVLGNVHTYFYKNIQLFAENNS